MVLTAIKKWITTEFLSGSVVGFAAMAFVAGITVYPYTKIPTKIKTNHTKIADIREETTGNSNDIKDIKGELESIDRTMRIIACTSEDRAETARRFLECGEFD